MIVSMLSLDECLFGGTEDISIGPVGRARASKVAAASVLIAAGGKIYESIYKMKVFDFIFGSLMYVKKLIEKSYKWLERT